MKYHLTQKAKDVGCKFEVPRMGDAGYDLYAAKSYFIPAGEQMLVETGLYVEIPRGYVGIVKDRSSVASRRLYRHAGVIDESYRGEWKIPVSNGGIFPKEIAAGSKFAQVVFFEYLDEETEEVPLEDLEKTNRGQDGFGSTGT